MRHIKIIGVAFIMGLILLNGLTGQSLEAQQPKVPMGSPSLQAPAKGTCREDPSITFTEEQTKQLENLERAFLGEVKPLWSEMRDIRLELRFSVSDPQDQSQVLLDKQRRMSSIQAKLENLKFSHLIRARTIFTKEQMERMPPDCPLEMEKGYGMRWGLERGPRKGIR